MYIYIYIYILELCSLVLLDTTVVDKDDFIEVVIG